VGKNVCQAGKTAAEKGGKGRKEGVKGALGLFFNWGQRPATTQKGRRRQDRRTGGGGGGGRGGTISGITVLELDFQKGTLSRPKRVSLGEKGKVILGKHQAWAGVKVKGTPTPPIQTHDLNTEWGGGKGARDSRIRITKEWEKKVRTGRSQGKGD